MENYDRIMAMQEAFMAQEMLLGISRERLNDRNIEIRTSEEGMRTLVMSIAAFNNGLIVMAPGIDSYRIDEKPIQDDDQIIF